MNTSLLLFFTICILAVQSPALAGMFFSTTICHYCKCIDATPYIMDCSDQDLTSSYAADETWPANKSNIRLIYDHNLLTTITALPSIDIGELSYRYNALSAVEDGAFQGLRRLHRLDLSHNQLSRSSLKQSTFKSQFDPNGYQPLPLLSLDLSYNNIHSIYEEALSHLAHLIELDLTRNPLTVLDHHTVLAVTSLPRLRVLRLAGCRLSHVPAGFLHTLNTLRQLDLADNQLTQVPDDLHHSHAITHLSLDNNSVTAVTGDTLRGLIGLETLNLSRMPLLEYLGDDAFSTLTSLRVLRCRKNPRLWSISQHIFRGMETSPGLFPLKEMLLSNNNLSSLERAVVPFWRQLLLLQLHDNPWQCDFRLAWMATDLLPYLAVTDPQAADGVICAAPPQLAGVALARAAEDGTLPSSAPMPAVSSRGASGVTLPAALSVGCLVIVSGTGVIIYMFWRREKIRQMYSNKIYTVSMLGVVVVLFASIVFFWFIIAAERSVAVPSSDLLSLRLIGSYLLFVLIGVAAAAFVVRFQTTAARHRARQQIRYRRAALEEEVDVEDSDHSRATVRPEHSLDGGRSGGVTEHSLDALPQSA